MNAKATSARDALLARAGALGVAEPNFSRFLMAALAAADAEDLAAADSVALEAALRRAYGLLGKRAPGGALVEVFPPMAGLAGAPEVLDVYGPDQPFMVDSVLAAVRALGGSIRLLSRPVLAFDPVSQRVLAQATTGSVAEAFLHIELEPLPGPDARSALKAEIEAVLAEVGRVVTDWRPMLERLRGAIEALRETGQGFPAAQLGETMQFLAWLADHNFTLLGMRDYALTGEGEGAVLAPIPESGLGLLRDPAFRFLRAGSEFVEMTPQHLAFLARPEPLLVTKANVRSRVHRRVHMDYVGVKLLGPDGAASGELRIIGLFTSMSIATPHTEVPLIRTKIAAVMSRSGLAFNSHAGKGLMHALDTYPRDELFQISEDQLFEFATAIAALADRPRVRVLARIDAFDNFVSILVYLPRDRYTAEGRERIGEHLARRYDGRVSAFYPHFPEGELVRVHFIIGRVAGPTPQPSREDLEAEVADLLRSFGDRLAAAAPEDARVAHYRAAFPPDYEARHTPEQALADIAIFSGLGGDDEVALRFAAQPPGEGGALTLKVYHRATPISLSRRVPLLENLGFTVIDESTFILVPRDGVERFVHEMVLRPPAGTQLDPSAFPRLEAGLLAVLRNEAESDGFSQLSLTAGLASEDVAVLRAVGRYLKQLGLAYSQRYLAAVLNQYPAVAGALIALFHVLHDPGFVGDRSGAAARPRDIITKALEATASLDEDRILRRFLNLVEATLRTNFYQRDAGGKRRPALALKFDCRAIEGMPQPRPYREIFVYSPRFEGLHLRFGAIARGGLRWSDRPEDFRTEVLALVKAQQVKNAIIVPVGAKGAFVLKQLPPGADRATTQAEGTACYRGFISALLEITDSVEAGAVVGPPGVVRRDGDDPYLVVAADKGTATFSDTANAIALEKRFWLGDAFASGGSAGYDHKKMGITARGAWEAVKRHFREMDRDAATQPFTLVGVGDMSGDVFGNFMLLSPAMKLVAAFDHRDIFIDPDPDAAKGFTERRRLFDLPRSSWQDYDRALISKGGGVFPRSAKSVSLTAEMRAALGLTAMVATPQEVILAILKARVDLLFFGGIGTYVRHSAETDAEAGDRANDAIRVSGREVGAKVVGEGANLAMTQRGRIEYALAGGRLNTDAIDNSAGVNSSDLEVNIKIALGTLVRAGTMTETERNGFLASMTAEVAALCLRNNSLQSLALSLSQRAGLRELPDHRNLMRALEQQGELSRAVEFLPPEEAIAERAATGKALTRPELAVLLAYAKDDLRAELLASSVPDDAYLGQELFRYFPDRLARAYPDTITGHRLRREVVATVLANAMINRGGPAYVSEMVAATSADAGQVAAAYAVARDAYAMPELNRLIDLLEGQVGGETQLALYSEVRALLVRETLWFLRNGGLASGLADLVTRYSRAVAEVRNLLHAIMPPPLAQSIAARAAGFEKGGAPRDLARRIAELGPLSLATDIALVAERHGASVADAARAFFGIVDIFRLGRIILAGNDISVAERFERMALDRALAGLTRAQRDLAADVLASGSGPVADRLAAWRKPREAMVARVVEAVAELTSGEITVSRLAVAAGMLSDLATVA